jgi:putative lipase involved disintegration of autophagic bodies
LAFGEYPFQTTCRSGWECVIEAIDLGSRKSPEYHSRKELIKIVKLMKMGETDELGCHIQYKCTDCNNWQFTMEENREFLVVTADKPISK